MEMMSKVDERTKKLIESTTSKQYQYRSIFIPERNYLSKAMQTQN